MSGPRRLLVGVVLLVLSVALGLVVALSLFLTSSRTIVLVGHDTVVRPTLSGDAIIQTGPLLPDFRLRDVGPVGVELALGKTEVGSIDELVQRYAFIASDSTAQVEKVQDVVVDMALSAALRGLGVGLVPVAVYLLLGRHRRRGALPGTPHQARAARLRAAPPPAPADLAAVGVARGDAGGAGHLADPGRGRRSLRHPAGGGTRHRDPHGTGDHPDQAAGAQRDRHL